MVPINLSLLAGKIDDHIVESTSLGAKLHREVAPALQKLKDSAEKAGFDLGVASGFRSFEAQLNIWNQKATGKRPILDDRGEPLILTYLSEEEVVYAILRWSALPGLSRHHWGTDLDVFDKKSVPPGYQIQLTPEEVSPRGMFGKFHAWLDANLEAHGFFRPYAKDLGGVSPERWHISYAPLSERFRTQITEEACAEILEGVPLKLKGVVLTNLGTLYRRFVNNITPPKGY